MTRSTLTRTTMTIRFGRSILLCPRLAPLGLIVGLAACGSSPPSPTAIRERASKLVHELSGDGADAFYSAGTHEASHSVILGLSAALGESGPSTLTPDDRTKLRDDAERFAKDLDTWLTDEVLLDENIESQSGDTTTFRVPATALCGSSQSRNTKSAEPPAFAPGQIVTTDAGLKPMIAPDAASPQPPPTTSSDCALAKVPVRLDVSFDGDAVNVGVRIGETDKAVFVITLAPRQLAIRLSLEAARDAVMVVAESSGNPLTDVPEVMKGALTASFRFDDDKSFRVALAVVQAVLVQGKIDGEAFSVDVPAIDPLLALTVSDGALVIDANWQAVAVSLPAKTVFGSLKQALTDPVKLLLAGSKTQIRATADGKLTLNHERLGTAASELRLGSQLLARVSLNGNDSGRLTLASEPWQDLPRCTLTPKLDLEVELAFAKLDAYLTDPAPAWANDRYRVLLSGEAGATVAPVKTQPDVAAATRAALRILDGVLKLQSFTPSHEVEVVVNSGSCLHVSTAPETPVPLLSGFSSGACPQ